jgi:hypothetical protein
LGKFPCFSFKNAKNPPFYDERAAIPIYETAASFAFFAEKARMPGKRFLLTVPPTLNLEFAAGLALRR